MTTTIDRNREAMAHRMTAARIERLARCVDRTADRLHDLASTYGLPTGKPLRRRGHNADGYVADQRQAARRLTRIAEQIEQRHAPSETHPAVAAMWSNL